MEALSAERKEITEESAKFDHKNHVLSRGFWDPKIMPLMKEFGEKWVGVIPPKGTRGYSPADFAFRVGGWAVDEYGATFSEFGVVGSGLYSWNHLELPWVQNAQKDPVPVVSTRKMSRIVKKAARLFGADLVGVTRIDPRWVYSIRVCPWNKPDTLFHRFVRNYIANSRLRKVALWADGKMGYGKKRKEGLFFDN